MIQTVPTSRDPRVNHRLQATAGFALLLMLAHRPGVPEPNRRGAVRGARI